MLDKIGKVLKVITTGGYSSYRFSIDGKSRGYGASLYIYKMGKGEDAEGIGECIAAIQLSARDMIDLIRVLKYYIKSTLLDYIKHI